MSRLPRVALVSREYPPSYGGGIGTYARWIVPALNAAGVRVHVITQAHDRRCARIESDGLTTVHRVPLGLGRGGWTNAAARFSIGAGRVIANLEASGQIDIAEFAECEGAAFLPILTKKKASVPRIIQLHTPSEQLYTLRSLSSRRIDPSLACYIIAERMALRLADAILAPSAFIADWAHEQYELPSRPTVIPYATGALPDPPAPASPDAPTSLFYAGRIEPRKGVESLIRAFSSVAQNHEHCTLRLAGADTSGAPDGGSMRAYLEELIPSRIRHRVEFLGRLNSQAMRDEYARARICLIPSLWENFPNVCIESMSNARAVLVGDCGGMREMIADSDAGLTFISGNERDLAAKLTRLLTEPTTRLIERGRIARARIEHMCDPQRIAKLRVEHFLECIESATPRHDPRFMNKQLQSWRQLEQCSAGIAPDLDLPKVTEAVHRWVEHEEPAPC